MSPSKSSIACSSFSCNAGSTGTLNSGCACTLGAAPKPVPKLDIGPNAPKGEGPGAGGREGVGRVMLDDKPKVNVGGVLELPGGFMLRKAALPNEGAGAEELPKVGATAGNSPKRVDAWPNVVAELPNNKVDAAADGVENE